MAKQRTENCRFLSRYTEQETYVSDAAYLVELICEKIAKKEGKILPKRFWNDKDYWGKVFRFQIKKANELLQDFDISPIIKALGDYRCKKLYSLGARFILDKVIREYEAKLANKKAVEIKVVETAANEGPRPQEKRGNLMSKLEELDE